MLSFSVWLHSSSSDSVHYRFFAIKLAKVHYTVNVFFAVYFYFHLSFVGTLSLQCQRTFLSECHRALQCNGGIYILISI